MPVQRFQARPVEVEAIQLTEATEMADMLAFLGDADFDFDEHAFTVTTASGNRAAAHLGDWLVRDSEPGTFYPCVADVFERKYTPVSSQVEADGRAAHPALVELREALSEARALADENEEVVGLGLLGRLDDVEAAIDRLASAPAPVEDGEAVRGDAGEPLAVLRERIKSQARWLRREADLGGPFAERHLTKADMCDSIARWCDHVAERWQSGASPLIEQAMLDIAPEYAQDTKREAGEADLRRAVSIARHHLAAGRPHLAGEFLADTGVTPYSEAPAPTTESEGR